MADLTLRLQKGSPVTFAEMDSNLLALDSDSPWKVSDGHITYQGKVGLGYGVDSTYVPTYALDFGVGDSNQQVLIGAFADTQWHQDNATDFAVWTDTTERFVISGASGNVGIGVSVPNQPLDVAGNIQSTATVIGNQGFFQSVYDGFMTIVGGSVFNGVNADYSGTITFGQLSDQTNVVIGFEIDEVTGSPVVLPTSSAVQYTVDSYVAILNARDDSEHAFNVRTHFNIDSDSKYRDDSEHAWANANFDSEHNWSVQYGQDIDSDAKARTDSDHAWAVNYFAGIDSALDSEHAWNIAEHTSLQNNIDSEHLYSLQQSNLLNARLDSEHAYDVTQNTRIDAEIDSDHAWAISNFDSDHLWAVRNFDSDHDWAVNNFDSEHFWAKAYIEDGDSAVDSELQKQVGIINDQLDSEHAWNIAEHAELQQNIDSSGDSEHAWNIAEHTLLQNNIDSVAGLLSGTDLQGVTDVGNVTTNDIKVGNLVSTGIRDSAPSTTITIDTNGNVGVGTNPGQLFHLAHPTGGDATIAIGALGSNLNRAQRWHIRYMDSSDQSLRFGSYSNGSVTDALKLDLTGDATVTSTLYSAAVEINNPSNSNNALRIQGPSSNVFVKPNGKIFRDAAAGIQLTINSIRPIDSTGVERDAFLDIGRSTFRFKDAYFSGEVNATTVDASIHYRSAAGAGGIGFDTANNILPYDNSASATTGVLNIGSTGNKFKDAHFSGEVNANLITSGDTSTSGSTALAVTYTANDTISTFGSLRSSGGTFIGYAVEPSQTTNDGVVSSAGNSNFVKGGVSVSSDGFTYSSAPAALTPVGNAVTLTERFKVAVDGTTTFSGNVTANSVIKSGGLATEFLMADGSVTTAASISASQVANAATFNNGGTGDASGTTFDGSAAVTISYNTVGAPSTTGTGASGNWGINITGNSATTTALATARNIGGVSFDGTANINLPGVNIAGNQDTSGNAATATALATGRNINGTLFDGSANITTAQWGTARNISIGGTTKSVNGSTNYTWTTTEIGITKANIDALGIAASTAATLATARTIGGVSFDGSANINLPGVNQAGNQNTSGSAGSVVNAVTFNNGGSGAASGTTFNGSAARTVSYNTVGAPSTTGTGASGSWGISITGNAATATTATTANGLSAAATITEAEGIASNDNDTTYPTSAAVIDYVTNSLGGGGATTFTGLTDTPASLGTAGQMVVVNAGATALEFVAAPTGTVTSVTAGAGMTQSGTNTINPTLDVVSANAGITVNANNIQLNTDQRGIIHQFGRDTSNYIVSTTSDISFFIEGNEDFKMFGASAGAALASEFHAEGDIVAFSSSIASDEKFKTAVYTIENALDKVNSLRGVHYTWKQDTKKAGVSEIGVIAQEVQAVIPEVVKEVRTLSKEGETHLTVDYAKLVGLLIEAVKELSDKIDGLESN